MSYNDVLDYNFHLPWIYCSIPSHVMPAALGVWVLCPGGPSGNVQMGAAIDVQTSTDGSFEYSHRVW